MMKPLSEKLPVQAKQIWRIYSIGQIVIDLVILGIVLYITRNMDIPNYIFVIGATVLFIYFVIITFFIPNIKWKIISYEVREHEIEIQTGLFIIKRTIIPIIRVQHVDVKQGPLIKQKKLANIDITTAATTHTIPLLREEDADMLRLKISELARVAKEDV